MKYEYLGRTGLKVSRLCLGTMNFGNYTSEENSYSIMNKAIELGINFFDTADVYGGIFGEGLTEKIIGRWLHDNPKNREQIVLATKVYGKMGEGPNDLKLSALHIKRACEASLKRLNTDYIDLYQMHHIDRNTPWDEIWQAMDILIKEGKVLYVGSSNFAAWNLVQAQYEARQKHLLGLVSEQSIYSLRNRNIELEVIPACAALGIGLLPWSPLAGGLLCGILDKPNVGRRTREPLLASAEKLNQQISKYENFCKERGILPSDIALSWVLNNRIVTSSIIGPRTEEQLIGSVKAVDLQLSSEDLKILNEIWPGPGNQAPEAYAW